MITSPTTNSHRLVPPSAAQTMRVVSAFAYFFLRYFLDRQAPPSLLLSLLISRQRLWNDNDNADVDNVWRSIPTVKPLQCACCRSLQQPTELRFVHGTGSPCHRLLQVLAPADFLHCLGGSDLSHYCERSRCVNTADAVDCVSWYHLLPVAQTLITYVSWHLAHVSIGTVLGFVISYRTTSSFERYNEGRKYWSQIILASRTLARAIWFHVPGMSYFYPMEDR